MQSVSAQLCSKTMGNRVFDHPGRSDTLLSAWLDGTACAANRGGAVPCAARQGVEIFT